MWLCSVSLKCSQMFCGTPHFYNLIWCQSQVVKLVELHHGKNWVQRVLVLLSFSKYRFSFFLYILNCWPLLHHKWLFTDTASVSNLSTCLSVFFQIKVDIRWIFKKRSSNSFQTVDFWKQWTSLYWYEG